jgi:DNA polymerase-3 subunit delta'
MSAALPWLEDASRNTAAALRAGRLPHALLIQGSRGSGAEAFAFWCAGLALCESGMASDATAPCGVCRGCRGVAARAHPDLVILGPSEDSREVRIEQVRELSADIALTSHRGGYKVGIITPADRLNRFAANALLKTLEEPPQRSLPSRVPATGRSRCQGLRIPSPPRAAALAWLRSEQPDRDWDRLLTVTEMAPLDALDADGAAVLALWEDTALSLERARRGQLDVVETAERWSRADYGHRLAAIENWLTDRLRAAVAPPTVHLSPGDNTSNIRAMFEILDAIHEARRLVESPLNRSLILERLLWQLTSARAGGGNA